MPLKLVTLTGADDHTPIPKLAAISKRFPFVEWGILWHPQRAGTGRYPSQAWISEFSLEAARQNLTCSLHLCGSSVPALLLNDPALISLIYPFGRLQLNWTQTHSPIDVPRLSHFINQCGRAIITPHNVGNAMVTEAIDAPCHEVLFDASGGTGVVPDDYPAPIRGKHLCGYAGGLGPKNIERLLPRIDAASHGLPYWVDMEQNVRDNQDRFDLREGVEVLLLSERFMRQASRPAGLAMTGT